MTAPADAVFLLDVDNTLLDNDHVIDDLRNHLEREFGPENKNRYWEIFEALRAELGYADYLGALQCYRLGALNVIEHLHRLGPTVILSDGDVVFQPRKVQRSGLWEAVEGRVLIYIHKERMLDDVEQRYPARHYVMVDDKLRILAAMREGTQSFDKSWNDLMNCIVLKSDVLKKAAPAGRR